MSNPGEPESERDTNAALLGKTVRSADVNGHGVCIVFTDGTTFDYSASDGGYSCWSVERNGRKIV